MALAGNPELMMHPKGQILRFAVSGARLRSPRCLVPLSNAWRAVLLAELEARTTGRHNSFLFSGRCADGTPDKEHAHAFYLADVGRESTITGLRIVSPLAPFSHEELQALRSIVTVTWAGPSTRLNLILIEEHDCSLFQVASVWESITPYVPPRAFHQDKPRLTPARQLADELRADLGGRTDAVQVACTPIGKVPVRCVQNGGAVNVQTRLGYTARFKTTSPICGPVLLGHSAHFGLGQFRPG
jgi:CRISPR-associated protein Csb2